MLPAWTHLRGYSPGDSPMHRLHARTKYLMFFLVAATVLAVGRPVGLGLLAGCSLAAVAASSPRRAQVNELVRIVLVLSAVSLLLNALFTPGRRLPGPELVAIWPTVEGAYRGAVAALRLAALAALSFALVMTTSPRDLGEAVESSLGKVPGLRGAGLAVDVAARFAPGFAADAARVKAIRSVRVSTTGLGLGSRLREAGSYVLPLMVSAVRRAERLADAMDSRCYTGRSGLPRGAGRADYAALALTLAACGLALAFREV